MDAIIGRKMAISKTTRTHLIYQFIILTLLQFSIGYNELLPDRKFLILLAFLPIFCYQLLILACCMEKITLPSWISFLQPNSNEKWDTSLDNFENDFKPNLSKVSSLAEIQRVGSFPEVNDIPLYPRRRWEKSVFNIGAASSKCFPHHKKSKSWVNLSDSKSSERLSREESLDALSSLPDKKVSLRNEKRGDKARKREERMAKARSWKPEVADFDISEENDITNYKDLLGKEQVETSSALIDTEAAKEDSEISKSYSFPFRQKRLETWLEMKETNTAETNHSSGKPYWQSVGYYLAVKYEARRRQRALGNPVRAETPSEQSQNLQTSTEITPDSATAEKLNTSLKKSVKSASACMNKIKMGFSNLISKKKEEGSDCNSVNATKVSKPNLFKLKNKSNASQTKVNEKLTGMPEFPQFLSNDRSLIFYPKYIPFEKERFERDVKTKMTELGEEKKSNLHVLR